MMKQALVVLAVVGLAFSAPQPRKLFHEHFDDFMTIIIEEIGEQMGELRELYSQYEEFQTSMNYLATNNFKNLVYEMESLPEFNAVVDFLENDNIDIHFFIDIINELVESRKRSTTRATASGTTMSAFISDSIALFPKAKLAALFDEKMANDEEFSTAITNLQSEEWDAVFSALWDSETFQKEVQTLSDNGIDMGLLLEEVVAIFGQNK